ncbi:hypothetical protein FACS1894200_03140 [Spirochaetia bacterium]|nr:hypothetical protein FACS1894200_03140 [Spirochaetia bacterium]
MATKRPNIGALIDQSMEGRDLSGTAPATLESNSAPKKKERFKPSPKESVLVRFDVGDYAALQRIAEKRGTKASSLIRQAVKEIIKIEADA